MFGHSACSLFSLLSAFYTQSSLSPKSSKDIAFLPKSINSNEFAIKRLVCRWHASGELESGQKDNKKENCFPSWIKGLTLLQSSPRTRIKVYFKGLYFLWKLKCSFKVINKNYMVLKAKRMREK